MKKLYQQRSKCTVTHLMVLICLEAPFLCLADWNYTLLSRFMHGLQKNRYYASFRHRATTTLQPTRVQESLQQSLKGQKEALGIFRGK